MSSIASRRPARHARQRAIQSIKTSYVSPWTPPRSPTPFTRCAYTPSCPSPPPSQLPSSPLLQPKSPPRSLSPEAPSEVDRLLSPTIDDTDRAAKQHRREKNRRHCYTYRQTPNGRARTQAASSKFAKTPAGRALRKKYYYSKLGQETEERNQIRRRIEHEVKAAMADLVKAVRARGQTRSMADVEMAELAVEVAQGHLDEFMRQKEERTRRRLGLSLEGVAKKEEVKGRGSDNGIAELKERMPTKRRAMWEKIERHLAEHKGC